MATIVWGKLLPGNWKDGEPSMYDYTMNEFYETINRLKTEILKLPPMSGTTEKFFDNLQERGVECDKYMVGTALIRLRKEPKYNETVQRIWREPLKHTTAHYVLGYPTSQEVLKNLEDIEDPKNLQYN